jgi:hypothetical protein
MMLAETNISSLLIKLDPLLSSLDVWNRSHLVYIIETMCAIATLWVNPLTDIDSAGEDLVCHVLRATFGTRLSEAGFDAF